MANLTNLINFTAVFRTVGPTLTLQNTGAYGSGVSVTTRWVIKPPFGIPQTAVGASVVVTLPIASDGTFQKGGYSIQCIVNDGTDDSQLTRILPVTITNQQPQPAQQIDYSIPSIMYVDNQDYAQQGYGSPSISRSWSATRTFSSTAIVSNAGTFDLAVAGFYYFDIYTVSLTATVTYIPTGLTWATIIAVYTINDFVDVNALPTLQQMRGWLSDNDKHDCGCGGGCGGCAKSDAACLYALVKEYACAGQFDDVLCQVKKLYKTTHHGQPFKLKPDGSILQAVKLCPDAVVVTCGNAATSFTFDQITATTARINIVGATQVYDLVMQPGNKTFLGVTNGQVLTGLTASTVYTAPVLTTRCTGTANSVNGAGFSTTAQSNVLQISQQPTSQSVASGANATFTGAATATSGAVTYQWQLSTDNGVTFNAINGATSASYTVTNAQVSQSGYLYRLIGIGTGTTPAFIASNNVSLTVTAQSNVLQITTQPTNQSVTAGGNASFTVVAAATTGPITYQWQISTDNGVTFNDLTGETAATLTITGALIGYNGFQYQVTVTGTGTTPSTLLSSKVTLTVTAAVVYNWQFWISKDGTTDPFVNTTTAPNLTGGTMLASGTISSPGAVITIPTNTAGYATIDGKYIVLITDNTINTRAMYQNGASNGAIPGSVFRPLVTYTSRKANISSDTWALNVNDPIIFS